HRDNFHFFFYLVPERKVNTANINSHCCPKIYGTFVQNVHNSKTMSSISGFTHVDSIRFTQ
ncbi:MAG: hypothetical protein KAU60_10075, partial [Desulfobacterales bacterium]|nr:hypothetical protein [Desulfobacterales bacterium]